jgi:hypothetical protein
MWGTEFEKGGPTLSSMRFLALVTLFASLLGVCQAVPTLTHEFTAGTDYFLKISYSDAEDYLSVHTYIDGTVVFSVAGLSGLNAGWFSSTIAVDSAFLPSYFTPGYHTIFATFYTNSTFDGRELTVDGGTYLVGPPPGAEVPDTSPTMALFGTALAGMVALRRRT